MSINTKDLNFYHMMLGVALGAGGALVGMQVYAYSQKKQKKKRRPSFLKNHRYIMSPNQHVPSLIRSPDPPSVRSEQDLRTPSISSNNLDALGRELFEDQQTSENNEQQVQSTSEDVQTLLTLLYKIGEAQSRRENTLHRGISCNICCANPLNGIRFKCLNCVDYDVCSRCEPSCDHDMTHVFVKIAIPIPPLANPRTSLLPVFYPGKKSVVEPLKWEETCKLREKTHFDSTHIEVLYEQYKSLCTTKGHGITKDTFLSCLGPLSTKKNLVVDQLFLFYDSDKDGFINFNDFVHGMSVLSKGTKTERMKYIFKGYDLDKDGYISKDDLQQMLRAYHQLSMELVRDVVRSCEEEMMASYDDVGNRPISAVFNAPIPESVNVNRNLSNAQSSSSVKSGSTSVEITPPAESSSTSLTMTPSSASRKNIHYERFSAVEAMTQDAIVELVDQIMQKADLDKDGRLSESEFYQYAVTDTSLLCWFEAIDTVF